MRPMIDASIGGVRLYDYQKDALRSLRSALNESSAVVLQMPTGSGKTVAAAEFIRQESAKGPVWFVCHRREIIRQASRAFTQIGIRHGVIAPRPEKMGLGFAYDPDAKVKIASVQTLVRRIAKEDPPRLVVWDECHHVAAKTWAGIREQLNDARHVGLTATPERLDGKGLSDWFSDLICGPSIKDLVEAGRLSKIRMFAPSEPDLTNARISMGDYRKEDADAAMNTPVLIGNAVDEYKRHANGSRAIVFATSVETSRRLVDRFKEEGIEAAHIDATTPLDERDDAVAALADGSIKVLSNVEVFTEGVDVPAVDTIILFRPTRSLALYLQMVGRGMRIAEGKDGLTVLDHAGLVYEHGFPDVQWDWSLEGGARKRRVAKAREAGERMRKCPSCSHVHEPAPECPECGHVYAGREIAECDGVLRALPDGPPEGCETQAAFARRVGKSPRNVWDWLRKGMPNKDGYPIVGLAIEWVEENSKGIRDGYESKKDFASRVGVSPANISRLIKRGLPEGPHNTIHVADGLDWCARNLAPRVGLKKSGGNHVSTREFASEIGVSIAQVKRLRAMGLPTEHRLILKQEALAWLRDNGLDENNQYGSPDGEVPRRTRPATTYRYAPLPYGHETNREFASRCGISVSHVVWLKNKGLPHEEGKGIPVARALNWLDGRLSKKLPPSAWEGVEPE